MSILAVRCCCCYHSGLLLMLMFVMLRKNNKAEPPLMIYEGNYDLVTDKHDKDALPAADRKGGEYEE